MKWIRRLTATERPHIAIVDIGLPSLDGYEIAHRLRADPHAGFDMHLVKPVMSERLMEAIQDYSARSKQFEI